MGLQGLEDKKHTGSDGTGAYNLVGAEQQIHYLTFFFHYLTFISYAGKVAFEGFNSFT